MQYGKYLKGIANMIENTRCEIYSDHALDLEERKNEIDDELFSIQSKLRNAAELIGYYEE